MSISSTMRLARYGICCLGLGCSGNPSEALITQLHDEDVEIRREAVHALGEHLDTKSVIPALADAVDDSDTDVRRMAIYALGESASEAALFLPVLVLALKDPELSVRLAAALAIQKIEPDNESFIPLLIEALRAGEGGIYLEVAEMGPNAKWAVPTLVKLLAHPETKIRHLTAVTLGRLGPTASDAESALERRALKDPQEAVRQAAQQALGQIRSAPASER
jgi:HEAT repeat protein